MVATRVTPGAAQCHACRMLEDYDLYVIGAGSGGTRAARIAAGLGARVGIAEERYLGGTCVNVGCVPKKLLVYASAFSEAFEDAAGFGWTVGASRFDWQALVASKDREIQRLNGIYRRLLVDSGAEIHEARARFLDPHTLEVGSRKVRAKHILIAVGGWPFVPELPGHELGITSNEAFHLERLPERILIVGGGYIALEFACIFHNLGSRVKVAYRGERILRGFDTDVRSALSEALASKGIEICCSTVPEALRQRDGRIEVELSGTQPEVFDQVLFATGRKPNTQGLGLQAAGVELSVEGAVLVDSFSRTSVDHIYAVGDVTDRIALTPVAIAEGQAVAQTLFGATPHAPDHTDVPSAVFTQPAVACVGLTEQQARASYGAVEVYRSVFRPMQHTLGGRAEKTMMKLVVDSASDRVVGCHMVGPDAGEIIQGLAVAIKSGATKAVFDATVGIHPTAAEEFVTMRTPL